MKRKTAHELARELLAGPDLKVAIESCCGGCYVYPDERPAEKVTPDPRAPDQGCFVLVGTRYSD